MKERGTKDPKHSHHQTGIDDDPLPAGLVSGSVVCRQFFPVWPWNCYIITKTMFIAENQFLRFAILYIGLGYYCSAMVLHCMGWLAGESTFLWNDHQFQFPV